MMAAPGIVISGFAKVGPDRIVVDIANEIQEVMVGIHQDGFIASLEQMADPLFSGIDMAGVAETHILHDSG